MPTVKFYMAGQEGIIKDVASHELPPLAWSDGANVIFRDGKILRRDGYESVLGTPAVVPYWLMFAFSSTDAYWLYANLTKVYGTDGANQTNLTRLVGGDYNTTEELLWNGGVLTGVPVITNGIDVPQQWLPVGLSTPLADLSNWPSTDRCKVIKPFKNFLIAGNITRSGTVYPHKVKWSHPADPGSVPTSWDHTDPTKLAGEVDVGDDQPGGIVDMLALRDMMIIYKDNTVHGMQYIGGNSIFRFFPILNFAGLLSTHCVSQIKEGRAHVFATPDDFVVFDGQNTQSVLDEKWKKYVEDNLESASSDRSFVISYPAVKEAWFCFPTLEHVWPNVALVWNWQENIISFKELPECSFITLGAVTAVGDVWDIDTDTWDSDSTPWDLVKFRPSFQHPVGTIASGFGKIIGFDRTQQNDGAEYTAFIERKGLAVTGQDRVSGQIKSDISVRKLITRIWLKATGSPFKVQVGGQEHVNGPVTYADAQDFLPGTTKYLDFYINTPLIAIKFYSDSEGQWEVDGYDLEFALVGNL